MTNNMYHFRVTVIWDTYFRFAWAGKHSFSYWKYSFAISSEDIYRWTVSFPVLIYIENVSQNFRKDPVKHL